MAKKPAAKPTNKVTRPAVKADNPGQPNTASTGALADFVEEMPDNSQTLHTGIHDDAEIDLHFGGEIHDDDQMAEDWKPPAALEAPAPRANMVQRWIRQSLLGKSDAKNQSMQGQQGWRPRTLASVPGGQRGRYPTIKDKRTTNEFMVSGDLILCEMPQRMFDQMRDHYRNRSHGQVEAIIDNQLAKAVDPRGARHGMHAPEVVERSSHVSTRKPIVQADQ